MNIREHVPLSTLTTFKTGGPARFFVTCDSSAEIPSAVAFAREKKMPLIPLGGGSNMLAPDAGVEAVFARLAADSIRVVEETEHRVYSAQAGAEWDALVLRAVSDGSWGLENLSAIPGLVGAASVQNIGAYGAALSDTLLSVRAFDTRDGVFKTFAKDACAFGYRTSIFKTERDRYFIADVSFRLSKKPAPNLSYKDLNSRFGAAAPPLGEIREAVIAVRKEKFPPLSAYGTAGSFFLNPIVSDGERAALSARYPGMPFFSMPEGGVKMPLAWLFDRVLSLKGMREGKAFVWEKQPLVIAAEFGATSSDVRALAEKIRTIVKEKTGIDIAFEVRAVC